MTNDQTPDRTEISARLMAVAEHTIVAEWICCEPLDPKHTLCAQGYAALEMTRALLVDDLAADVPAAPLLDAVMGLLPAVVSVPPSADQTARHLLDRHGLPEDVVDGALCLHAQELAAVQRREAAVWGVDTAAGKHILGAADLIDPTRAAAVPVPLPAGIDRRAQLLDALDFAYCQGLGYDTPDALLDAYDAERATPVPPSADQTALRNRIAEALYAHDHLGWRVSLRESDVEPVYRERAAAVLAFLPEQADRAAVLEEAAQIAVADNQTCPAVYQCQPCLTRERVAAVLLRAAATTRRVAAEEQAASCVECGHPRTVHREGDDPVTPGECSACPDDDARHDYRAAVGEQPGLLPSRGDTVDTWLKTQRNEHRDDNHGQWSTLDQLLDLYRLHADTGTPLGQHVCEARTVGDCGCLEQPETQETPVLPCNYWTHTRTEHTPHRWEPQPGMDPVHCPGYSRTPE